VVTQGHGNGSTWISAVESIQKAMCHVTVTRYELTTYLSPMATDIGVASVTVLHRILPVPLAGGDEEALHASGRIENEHGVAGLESICALPPNCSRSSAAARRGSWLHPHRDKVVAVRRHCVQRWTRNEPIDTVVWNWRLIQNNRSAFQFRQRSPCTARQTCHQHRHWSR